VSRLDWLGSVLAWDGFFPLLVAVAPAMLPLDNLKGVLAEFTVLLFVPFAAALVRTHQGCRRLNEAGCGATPGRQLLLGCAIVALMFFEGLTWVLHYAVGAPRSLWWTAGGLYLGYLGLIVAALRPRDMIEAEPDHGATPGR
jgi:hypothetical protein